MTNYKLRNAFSVLKNPEAILRLGIIALLVIFIVVPLLRLGLLTVEEQGLGIWAEVVSGRIARQILWIPLRHTLTIGVLVALGTVLLGGFMAWLVTLTNVPGRRVLGALASLPFIIPSFATVFAWEVVFRNELIGGRVGLLHGSGIHIPDWLAWGEIPIVLTLVAHYYALPFLLISTALTAVNTELVEAGEITGASRLRVLSSITLPLIWPTLFSAALLAFAEGVSNFSSPALLGLPVRYQTISTRIFGLISTGQTERGYVLTFILIAVAAGLLWANNRLFRGRRSFATLSGKGGRRKRMHLGFWRWPAFVLGLFIGTATTIIPLIILLLSSLSVRTNSLTSGLSSHYWLGEADPNIAQGQAGIFHNPQILDAAKTTISLGILAALLGISMGLLIAYATRIRGKRLNGIVAGISYIPFFIPSVAFGAMYIAQFGRSFGPIPALYGTFTLLVLASAVKTLPFSTQTSTSALRLISVELEEAAVLTGASFPRRITGIFLPLAAPGLIAGAILIFVKMVRDLSLVILLVTPASVTLSVLAFRYASDGFGQFANAITVIIALISIIFSLIARRLQTVSQPWAEAD